MKLFKLLILIFASNYFVGGAFAQANPTIAVQPSNAGIVAVGGTIDIIVTIGNTGIGSIAVAKLRPLITLPPSVRFKDTDPFQNAGLPLGWSVLSNTATQLRLCNTTDVIPGGEIRTIILKAEGVSVAPATTFIGNINFGNGTTCAVGPQVAGNNPNDDNATSTIQVVSPCGLTVTATAGIITCNAGTTTITASSTGVAGLVEYSINGGAFQASNLFTTIGAGSYVVTGRQVSNLFCTNSITLIISEPTQLQTPTITIVQPSCVLATGSASITSPTSGLTFSINGSASFNAYTGPFTLAPGIQTIQAKNSNGCLSPISNFTINTQPITPATPILGNITQPNCSISTGSLVLSGLPIGNWSINPGNVSGNTTSITLNNLPAGTYNYTVTNSEGCSSPPTGSVTINAVVGAPAAPSVSIVQPTCAVSTGSIFITSSTTGLTFSLDNGPYTPYPVGGFTSIASGNHTLIVQNISGCLSPFTNFTINAQPLSPPPPTVNIIQPTCTISTGIIRVTSDTTGFTFSLDGAAFTSYPTGGYSLVAPGTHNLQVKNNSGCAPSITNNIIVNAQPQSPTASATASAITCFGSNSTLSVTASGGTLPYEFSLNNNGTFQSENTFSVPTGTYFVVVKGANGCTTTTNNVVVVQPTAIVATLGASAIACSGGFTTLTVLASGGSGVFEYSLNNSANFQTSNVFNNIGIGTYSVKVRPVTNPSCVTTTASLIITQPDSVRAITTALPISKCGGVAEVKVSALGGKPPYIGTGTFTRGPGKFIFTITDANGCTASSQVHILPPGCVNIKVAPNPVQNTITVNHPASENASTIQIFASNGAKVITKAVPQNTFISTLNVSSLAAGVYILVYINGDVIKEVKFIKTNNK